MSLREMRCLVLKLALPCVSGLLVLSACLGGQGSQVATVTPSTDSTGTPCVMFDIEEVRGRVSFPIAFPARLPTPLELEAITLTTEGDPTVCKNADAVRFEIKRSGRPTTSRLQLIERSYPVRTADANEMANLTIGGRDVEQLEVETLDGKTITIYKWEQGDVYFQITNPEGAEVTDATVRDLIQVIPAS